MEPYKENGTINLRRPVIKQPAIRLIGKTPNPHSIGGFSATNSSRGDSTQRETPVRKTVPSVPVNLTNNNFSVTRARASAHAYAHARANNSSPRASNDADGLRRVLSAALNGGDVKVASIKPMSFSARFIAFLLLPAMLVMPILPAYANEAPLSERVAGDVADILGTNDSLVTVDVPSDVTMSIPSSAEGSEGVAPDINLIATSPESESSGNSEVSSTTPSATPSVPEVAGASSDEVNQQSADEGGALNTNLTDGQDGSSVPTYTNSETTTSSSSENNLENDNQIITPLVLENKITEIIEGPSATTSDTDVVTPDENLEEVQVIDIPSVEVQEDLDSIRARLRKELRDEVKMEVKGEIEKEVYRGCKNLDGVGYYCIPDAKSFGPALISSERSISVVVQSDEIEGDKEIFLTKNNISLQLTHNTDDDVFPVLDPSSDLLVWQSLVNGHWQIAYARVNDIGVPKVNYLTNGENNFNPKIYRGRIVWQAWVEGNWEIFQAIRAYEKLGDDALTAEHREVGVDGNWNVKRITANNTPDMFPSVTGDSITWQAIDEGVWQVFSYDLTTGESHRVSKKGVKSESPRTALIWNEEDETGQLKLVGSDVNRLEDIDFTELARRLVDQSKDGPKSPITNTEIVVISPTIVRVEEEAPVLE